MARKSAKGVEVGVIFQERLAATGMPQAQALALLEGVEDLISAHAAGRGPTRTEFENLTITLEARLAAFENSVNKTLLEFQRENGAFQGRIEARFAEAQRENAEFRSQVLARLDASDRKTEALDQKMGAMFEATDRKIEGAYQKIEALDQKMGAMFEATDRKIEGVHQKIEALDQKMGAMFEATDRKMEFMFNATDRKIEALDSRSEKTMALILDEIREMRKEIKELSDRVTANENHVKNQGWRLGGIVAASVIAGFGVLGAIASMLPLWLGFVTVRQ